MKNITVFGIGRLGLVLSLLLESKGYNIMGVDIFENYVKLINDKELNSDEPSVNDLLKSSNNFKATTDMDEGINHSDILFIMVQTPNSGGDKFYDHNVLSNLLISLNSKKVKDKHIIIGCTVMPGYIESIGKELIKDCEGCTLSYNPEFIAQGDIFNGLLYADMVLLGTDSEKLGEIMTEVYTNIMDVCPAMCIMSPTEAEIVKISLNSYITTKIAFANTIGDLCKRYNCNQNVVLNAIGSDSRVGNKYFKYGYSYGGPCFPRDTLAFKQLLEQNDVYSGILDGTYRSNEFHIKEQSKDYSEDIVTFENVCYKENSKVAIIENSAKLKIAEHLVKRGKKVIIKDIPSIIKEVQKEYGNMFEYDFMK